MKDNRNSMRSKIIRKRFLSCSKFKEKRCKMDENKMQLINKLFNNETIRTIWDKDEEKYYISVVDIVGVLAESKNPTVYWRVLKKRLKEEGNETVTNCNGLKLKAKDGKYRMTDVCDIEGMFRIIESIPSKNAEPIKQWLAHLGTERDNIDNIELILTDLSEEATKRLATKQKPNGLKENIKVAKMGGHAAKVAREDIEKNLGESVVSKTNKLDYEYIEDKKIKKLSNKNES